MDKDRTMYANEIKLSVNNNDVVMTFNLLQPQTEENQDREIIDSYSVFMTHNLLNALHKMLQQFRSDTKEL